MYRKVIAVLVIGFMALSLPTQAANASVKKFASCKELNKKYPGGVARDANAQNKNKKGELQESSIPPTVNAKLYKANSARLDKDKDGIACEK